MAASMAYAQQSGVCPWSLTGVVGRRMSVVIPSGSSSCDVPAGVMMAIRAMAVHTAARVMILVIYLMDIIASWAYGWCCRLGFMDILAVWTLWMVVAVWAFGLY